MVCAACGNPIPGPGAFCSKCGVQAPGYPPPPAYPPPAGYPPGAAYPQSAAYPPVLPIQPRVARHLQTLGILWFVYGAYRAITGVFGALFLAGIAPHVGFGPWGIPGETWGLAHGPFWTAIVGVVLIYTAISAVLSFVVGYGITTRRPWGRMLAIVTAVLALIRIPAGTALGIYTLWVLMSGASAAEYDALAYRG